MLEKINLPIGELTHELIELTDQIIEMLQYSEGGPLRQYIRDRACTGLSVRLYPSGTKSFQLLKPGAGGSHVILGRANGPKAITLEQARQLAQDWRAQFKAGKDPHKERKKTTRRKWEEWQAPEQPHVEAPSPPVPLIKKVEATEGMTFGQAFEAFIRDRKLKAGTAEYYRTIASTYLKDWLSVPAASIDREDVCARHQFITTANGATAANVAMRIASAIFNFTQFRFRNVENPTIILTQCRMWNRLRPKHRYIKKDQLAEWYRAVQAVKSDNLRDWLLLILFTGLRKTEAARMTWRNVDFADRSFVIEDTKNGKEHSLPMSSFVFDLLWRRRQHTPRDVEWVFPNRFFNGPMSAESCTYERVGFESGIRFSPHDLRRTFVALARLVRADHYTIKQLLNHSGGNDITYTCYAIKDIETLRAPIEAIAQALKFYMGIGQIDKVDTAFIDVAQISVLEDYVDAEIVV